jgi:nicotinamide mononucleotide transporter
LGKQPLKYQGGVFMSFLDLFGLVTAVICVYMIVKENDWNWPVGIINSIVLLVVFLRSSLYAQVGLQALYVIEGFFGWYKWLQRDKVTMKKVIKINKITGESIAIFALIEIAGVIGLTYIFKSTSDPAPFLDSLITVSSIVAELMLCWKLYESWIIYLLTDLVSIGLLLSQGMYLTTGTYAALTILCIMGMTQWHGSLQGRGEKACQ